LGAYRFPEGPAPSGAKQDPVWNPHGSAYALLQGGTVEVAKSSWSGIFSVGIPGFLESAASVTGRPEGVEEHVEEGRNRLFPDLLSPAHLCLTIDRTGRVAPW
jgi:hypothetical protein